MLGLVETLFSYLREILCFPSYVKGIEHGVLISAGVAFVSYYFRKNP